MKRITFFQFYTCAVLFVFMSILAFVTITAYSRRSGSTSISMISMQKIRAEAGKQKAG